MVCSSIKNSAALPGSSVVVIMNTIKVTKVMPTMKSRKIMFCPHSGKKRRKYCINRKMRIVGHTRYHYNVNDTFPVVF